IIEETLSNFQITIAPHEALKMARRMIENGGNPNTTIRISSIATALARDRGIDLPGEEVRKRFFERRDARMEQMEPGEKLRGLLKEFSQRGFGMGRVTGGTKPRRRRQLATPRHKD